MKPKQQPFPFLFPPDEASVIPRELRLPHHHRRRDREGSVQKEGRQQENKCRFDLLTCSVLWSEDFFLKVKQK